MPTFPFIPYKPKRKKPILVKSPPFNPRYLNTGSPHPYVTAEVIDVRGAAARTSQESYTTAVPPVEAERNPSYSNARSDSSPRVNLDLDINPGSFTDWFTPEFLNSEKLATTSSIRSNTFQSAANRIQKEDELEKDLQKELENGGEKDDANEEDDEGKSISSEDVLTHLLAMDASNYYLSEPQPLPRKTQSPTLPKKTPPKPIKIPSSSLQVQVVRSADLFNQSQPQSQVSSPESSAVSGTTLARALLGNTFVGLYSDSRSTRHRSGFSGLVRSDSATLPKGEHSFSTSPFWADRNSFGVDSLTSAPDSPIPPIPANAELLYVPPKTPRNSSSDREKRKIPALRRHSSTGSISMKKEVLSANPRRRSASIELEETNVEFTSRRVSLKSEAVLSTPPTPVQAKTETLESLQPDDQANAPTSKILGHQHYRNDSRRELDLPTSPDPLSPQSIPHTPGQSPMSDPPSSANDLEILEYYSGTQVEPEGNFRPIFSPIPEESSSQLSPPTPFMGDRRNSQTSQSDISGRFSHSPLSPSVFASELAFRNLELHRQQKISLLPIGERHHSTQLSPAPSSGSTHQSSPSLGIIDLQKTLMPPPVSRIFNRERSPSAPSPIKVVRDSKDINMYNITVSPLLEDGLEGPPSANSDGDVQTFPETPKIFSPIWSPASNPSPNFRGQLNGVGTPSPGEKFGGRRIEPSLLMRVGSVRGARPSRQASISRNKSITGSEHRPASTSPGRSITNAVTPTMADEAIAKQPKDRAAATPELTLTPPLDPSQSNPPALDGDTTPLLPVSSQSSHDTLHDTTSSDSGSQNVLKSRKLPIPRSSMYLPIPPMPTLPPPSPAGQRTPPPWQPPTIPEPSFNYSQNALHNTDSETSLSVPRSQSTPLTIIPVSPASQERLTDRSPSPPSYDVVMKTYPLTDNATPSTSSQSGTSQFGFGSPNLAITPPSGVRHTPDPTFNSQEPTSIKRRPRTRPPLPAGPRMPLLTSHPPSSFTGTRERNASVSSVRSNSPFSGVQRQIYPAPFSPKFQNPVAKWRGYTMEAAKWTFSSAQLQAIVQRAIKQSAEASSIRLLRLETLDNEIEEERHRLEMHKTDVKATYKQLSRRRIQLLASLSNQLEVSEDRNPASAIRVVEELRDNSETLDRLAEDLHTTSELLWQLKSLCQVHSYSALAMALRKLNASFLKQLAEAQVLRNQIATLGAERDEAWRQAEVVANDFDDLSQRVEAPSPEERRSSRVFASRKSSVRVSRAGLRSSQRSSLGSNGQRLSATNFPSSAKTSMYSEKVPPVPPIPRHRPGDIRTDLSVRSSAGLSTDVMTSTSEIRALVQAQEDLYQMLGISIAEPKLRRSRSAIIGSPRAAESATLAVSLDARQRPDYPALTRPSSLPPSSTLAETQQALNVDQNAMLATIGMLASDE